MTANAVLRGASSYMLELAVKGVSSDIKLYEYIKKEFPNSLMAESADKLLKTSLMVKKGYVDELQRRGAEG